MLKWLKSLFRAQEQPPQLHPFVFEYQKNGETREEYISATDITDAIGKLIIEHHIYKFTMSDYIRVPLLSYVPRVTYLVDETERASWDTSIQ